MNRVEDKTAELIDCLEDSEKAKIRAAVDALVDLSAASPCVRTALEASLDDERRKNHWALAYVLGQLPQPSDAAIRALLGGLNHGEPDIRWAIALLLVRLARSDGSVLRLLLALCASGTVNQRRMAAYCIRDLQLADDASMAALSAAARDQDPTVRVAALTSLRWRRDASAAARCLLLDRYLNDEDGRVRNAAAVTLAQLGAPDEAFIRALEQNARSDDAHARKAATAALNLLQNKRPAPVSG
jgi:HEAT repeat protein